MSHQEHFMIWWRELNAELAKIGEAECLFADARYWHEHGTSPDTTAQLIVEDRKTPAVA